ncbi:MAG: hypothetical protein L3J74_15320 [Bacteroidales bacterium]|nr:hypothetical protein [Bacteroidales bacterium]
MFNLSLNNNDVILQGYIYNTKTDKIIKGDFKDVEAPKYDILELHEKIEQAEKGGSK